MSPWAAIVGTRETGRPEAMERLLPILRGAGLRLGGFVQERVYRDDTLLGYDVVDLASGERAQLARESGPDADLCSWAFEPSAFETCRRWASAGTYDITLLELGRLEAAGTGHWQLANDILQNDGGLVLIQLRPHVLAQIALQLPDPVDGLELPASEEEIGGFGTRIAELASV